MGTFSVALTVQGPTGELTSVDALVDTGSTYAVLPAQLLKRMGVTPKDRMSFRLADERVVEYDLGEVVAGMDGRERTVLVVFGPNDATPLLGAVTLELFGMSVEPLGQRLVPVEGLLKGRR